MIGIFKTGEEMKKEVVLTKEGLEKIKNEILDLKNNKRPEVIERIQSARALGDLSENSEYDDARNEQSFIEGRIEELETMVANAKVVDKKSVDGTISLGSVIECEIDGDKEEYEIVSSVEANPILGKISIDSPFGNALQGKKAGDTVLVHAPDGTLTYKILNVK
jgi:transcription elongation factor GreA